MPEGTYAPQPHQPTITTAAPALPLVIRSEALVAAISQAIEERRGAFTIEDALKLPAVERGMELLTSVGSGFPLVAYQGGAVVEQQPRILSRPDPFSDLGEFLSKAIYCLATEGWAPILLEYDDDSDEFPRSAIVLDPREVAAEWDERRFLPRYSWRGEPMEPRRLKVIRINPRPGELLGRGPLRQGLDALAVVKAAEDYALSIYASGGLPEIVIKVAQAITNEQATGIKSQYLETRKDGLPVAVVGSGADITVPNLDPERGQMHQSRSYGATIASRVLGIPAPLLMVETSGATILYSNSDSAIEALTRWTLGPTYLRPIERAFSEWVPRNQTVRFELSELQRASIHDRAAAYKTFHDIGAITSEEVRQLEGWGAGPHSETDTEEKSA